MATEAKGSVLPVFDREEHTRHPPRMTFEEFVAWVPDGVQAEWVDGEVVVLTNSTRHGRLSGLLFAFLGAFVRMLDFGQSFHAPFLVRARPDGPGREPDIVVVRTDHLDRIGTVGMTGSADLVAEVLSDETARTDLVVKRREYQEAGIPEYVILEGREGRERFWFYRLDAAGTYRPVPPDAAGRYHSEVLSGLWIDPGWFARDPLPLPEQLMLEVAPDAYLDWIESLRREVRGRTDGK